MRERGVENKDISPASVTTDDIDIGGNDFVVSNEVFMIAALPPQAARTASTSATSFALSTGLARFRFRWDQLFPTGSTSMVGLLLRQNVGSGETYTVRYRNKTDSETLLSIANTSTGNYWSGWNSYTPTTTDSLIQVDFEHKISNGVNSSSTEDPLLLLGIQL